MQRSGGHRERLLAVAFAAPLLFVSWLHSAPITSFRATVCGLELFFILAFLAGRRSPLPLDVSNARRGLWLLGGWLLSAGCSVLLSTHPVPALCRQSEWLCHILFAFTLWCHLKESPSRVGWIAWLVPAGFILAGLRFLFLWYRLEAPEHYNWYGSPPGFSHIRHVGYYALAALIYSMGLVLRGKAAGWARTAGILSMVFSLAVLFWAGGRGALASAGIGAGALFLLSDTRRRWRLVGTFAAACVLGGVGAALYPVQRNGMGFFDAIVRSEASASLDVLMSGRLGIWRRTLAAVWASPMAGLGPDGYMFITPKLFGVHPHSFLLQFWVEWGVVGGALFLALLACLVYRAVRRARADAHEPRQTTRLVAISLIFAYTANGLVDGLYYHALPLMVLAVSFAVALQPADGPTGPVPRDGTKELLPLPPVAALAVIAALVMAGQLAVLRVLKDHDIPDPRDLEVQLLSHFPASTYRLERWVNAWRTRDPEAALRWAHWGHRHSTDAWRYFSLEAEMLARRGDHEPARSHAREAIASAPLWMAGALAEKHRAVLEPEGPAEGEEPAAAHRSRAPADATIPAPE